MDVEKAVGDSKGGKITYRVDKFGNIQVLVGKVSFDSNKLIENIQSVIDVVRKLRPSTVKGVYLKNVTISSTMGPGVKLEVKKTV
jgi:large subunit ribosomal protein L1